jgi:hypothetical protein
MMPRVTRYCCFTQNLRALPHAAHLDDSCIRGRMKGLDNVAGPDQHYAGRFLLINHQQDD